MPAITAPRSARAISGANGTVKARLRHPPLHVASNIRSVGAIDEVHRCAHAPRSRNRQCNCLSVRKRTWVSENGRFG